MSITRNDIKALKKVIKERGIESNKGWSNFSQDLKIPNAIVLKIETEDDLVAIVKVLYELNQDKDPKDRILYRALAGGRDEKYSHSFSLTPCGEANIIFNLVGDEFSKVKWIDEKKHLVMVGPSIQVGPLDKTLYYDFNLMLKHSASLIERVTRAGLMANAGHGTGNQSGSYADNVEYYRFLLPNGKIAYLTADDPLFKELAPAHLGNIGIDLGAVLKCQPAQKYKCVMEAMSLPEFIERVKGGLFTSGDYPLASAMYAPTYQHDLTNHEVNNVIVYRWKPVPIDTPDKHFSPTWREVEQWFGVELMEDLHITDFISCFPEITPLYMQYLVAKGGIGEGKRVMVGPAPEVYHYQVEYPHKLNDFDCLYEISPDSHEVVDTFIKLAEKIEMQADQGEYPITYAAYARVFNGTNGGLSTSAHTDGKKVCGFDVVSSPCIPGFEELRTYMVNYLINTYDAKLHWGKYVPGDIDYEKMYGVQMAKYKAALEKWHIRHGLRLEKNPALNHFFCRVLKMPDSMTPEPLTESLDYCLPQYSASDKAKMAKAFLLLIRGDTPEAENMRAQLNAVIAKHSETKHSTFPFSLFDSYQEAPANESPGMSPHAERRYN